jgi:hypothetical protein
MLPYSLYPLRLHFSVLVSDPVSQELNWANLPTSGALNGRMTQCRQCLGPVPRLGQVTAAVDLSIAPLPFNCSQLQTMVGPWIRDTPPNQLC